jgi:hypothetical protein
MRRTAFGKSWIPSALPAAILIRVNGVRKRMTVPMWNHLGATAFQQPVHVSVHLLLPARMTMMTTRKKVRNPASFYPSFEPPPSYALNLTIWPQPSMNWQLCLTRASLSVCLSASPPSPCSACMRTDDDAHFCSSSVTVGRYRLLSYSACNSSAGFHAMCHPRQSLCHQQGPQEQPQLQQPPSTAQSPK